MRCKPCIIITSDKFADGVELIRSAPGRLHSVAASTLSMPRCVRIRALTTRACAARTALTGLAW
jgi:hypothetical protein